MKITSPDYLGVDKDDAVKDFVARIKHYENHYESVDEDRDRDWSFIKIFNQGEKFLVNRVQGKCEKWTACALHVMQSFSQTINPCKW